MIEFNMNEIVVKTAKIEVANRRYFLAVVVRYAL